MQIIKIKLMQIQAQAVLYAPTLENKSSAEHSDSHLSHLQKRQHIMSLKILLKIYGRKFPTPPLFDLPVLLIG